MFTESDYDSYDLVKLLDEFEERKLTVPVVLRYEHTKGYNIYYTLYDFTNNTRTIKISVVVHSLGEATERIYKQVLTKFNFIEELKRAEK